MRRLEVTVAGKWFLALTVLLGVVAINSGNNVIYLIESMLLSGLILSGVLSELFISSLRVELARREAYAGSRSRDLISIENRSRFFLFCIEVGEWKDKKFIPYAFFPRVPPRKKISLPSEYAFPIRGEYRWDGLVIATMYPFGFARKLRILQEPGVRTIWPALLSSTSEQRRLEESSRQHQQHNLDISEGDIRQYQSGDDPRLVVWTLSAMRGEWWVRERRKSFEPREFVLDIQGKSGSDLERAISGVAGQIEKASQRGERPILLLKSSGEQKRLASRAQAMDALARVQP